MVEVEVRAAHNVLEACAQTETMERVVFTSSVTAVIWKEERRSTATVDERDWSEPNFCRGFKVCIQTLMLSLARARTHTQTIYRIWRIFYMYYST